MMLAQNDTSKWVLGGTIALAGHAAVLAGLSLVDAEVMRPVIEHPVVLVELPPQAASASTANPAIRQTVAEPQPQYAPPQRRQTIVDAPTIRAPLPKQFVTTPPVSPRRTRPPPVTSQTSVTSQTPPTAASTALSNEAASAPQGSGTGTAPAPGDNPKAKREEADYFSLLSSHLNRKKRYPTEAKKARQQGVVTVRFTVHSDGRISGSSIRNSSGHDLLDQATLDLMQRVAPLPKFPKSMTKDSITISLPIDYSLRTR